MWIDFDVAITYPNISYIGDKQRAWIDIETGCVEDVGKKLVGFFQFSLLLCDWRISQAEDQKQGLPPNTKYY